MSLQTEALLIIRRHGIKARWDATPESLKRKANRLLKRFNIPFLSLKSPPALTFKRLVERKGKPPVARGGGGAG